MQRRFFRNDFAAFQRFNDRLREVFVFDAVLFPLCSVSIITIFSLLYLKYGKANKETYLPEFKFTTDNAAMIAIAGYFHYLKGERTPMDVAPVSRISDF